MHKKYRSFLIFSLFILLLQSVSAGTLEFSLQGDGDIVNQTGANLDENSILCQNLKPESWIGSEGGSQGIPSYLALRFHSNQSLTGIKLREKSVIIKKEIKEIEKC